MKEAINAGKSPIMPGNKRMKATFYALKLAQSLSDKLGRKPTKEELSTEINNAGVVSEPAMIALAIVASVSAISIIAVCLKRKVILIFRPDGSVELKVK